MTPQLERLGYSNYTLTTKRDNQKIGTCGLYDREGLKGIDIGFAFLPEFERKGFAYESSNKLKEVAFSEFGIKTISAITAKNNISSQVVKKVKEGSGNIVDLMKNAEIDILVNTTSTKKEILESFSIRRTALIKQVPYFTTIAGATAAIDAIDYLKKSSN